MNILAIDSTATTASVALTDEEHLIALYTFNRTLTHSETLLPMVESVLNTAKMTVGDIDLFACSAGPGSFTGVRIGAAAVKGLAFGQNKPCVGISTLEALAENLAGIAGDAIICPVMDARRNQVYNALFCAGERLTQDRAIPLTELADELRERRKEIFLVGDGYALAAAALQGLPLRDTPEMLRCQSAYSVARTALRQYRQNPGEYSDSQLLPTYLRPSQAERTKNEQ